MSQLVPGARRTQTLGVAIGYTVESRGRATQRVFNRFWGDLHVER